MSLRKAANLFRFNELTGAMETSNNELGAIREQFDRATTNS
ncbi:MAG: hypothetical protein ACRCYU_09100 [Nocardioides sp.]